ncbi:aquaporin AQPAe.a-like isoform X2 [Physella acuta]|nr:aquaporin AQPAe.a-like isoform X2 [Physella acuta]XP_059153219.1 aquaporin AQPAe.a-like isoform X2 [Physella acuta]XP_059153287.1 aquaporin AQPAe.a-like isoform X2 [Physella acuta]XP_059153335.1 aquaporin AQPAe.a-like isoform X2 [Physella acuta]
MSSICLSNKVDVAPDDRHTLDTTDIDKSQSNNLPYDRQTESPSRTFTPTPSAVRFAEGDGPDDSRSEHKRRMSVAPRLSVFEPSNAADIVRIKKTYGAQVNLGYKIPKNWNWIGGTKEFTTVNLYRQLATEFFGTFLLVSMGCSVLNPFKEQGTDAALDMSSIMLSWGFIVASLVWTIAHVSGCFLNPAVTISMFVNKRIPLARCLAYICVQVPAAICGSAFHTWIRGNKLNTTCQTLLNREMGVTEFKGFIVEMYLTFILLFFVFATTDSNRQDHGGSHALMVGGVIVPLVNIGAEMTGAAMNPARAMGPAVIHGNWDAHYIYWFGPIVGGVLGGLFYDVLFSERVVSWHRDTQINMTYD